jgi:hypothetical protein
MQVGLLLRPQPAPDRNCVLLIVMPVADPPLLPARNRSRERPNRERTNGHLVIRFAACGRCEGRPA